MTPSAKDIQDQIINVVGGLHPHTPTAREVTGKFPWKVNKLLPRVAINMVMMSKDGRLELVRKGWDDRSKTKRYRLPLRSPCGSGLA